ncbi:MAG: glycosyltransferase [Paracoccaceae bacterium]|jgi:lipopolysaccharide biosynthesis glycosyltransferase|nr:glycosyltransferase [Paracoccaceae bacterium]
MTDGPAGDDPHILYFYDAAFAACTRVSLLTALERTPGPLRVTLHPTEPDAPLDQDLHTLAEAFPEAALSVREVDLSPHSHLPRGRLPLAARSRLLMPRLHDGRALYLDGDTLVRRSLRPLWETDLQGACLGAALAPGVQVQCAQIAARAPGWRTAKEKLEKRSARLDGIEMARYVNNGVMVLDLARIRAEGLDAAMADIDATARYTSRDQDYMNVIFRDRIHLIDPTWNSGWGNPRTRERFVPKRIQDRFRASRDDPAIVHFTGFEKPWQAPTPPFQVHLMAKPFERRSRARWWAEFHSARDRAEAVLGRRLWQ